MPSAHIPIRVAFLGADETTPALLRAAIGDRRFEIAGICEFEPPPGAAAELRSLASPLVTIHEWESLLDDERVEAVVVARGAEEDRRAEQMRKFVQTGRPVLASHPVQSSMLVYYELDMIRRETGAVMVPDLARRHHPAVVALGELVRAGDGSPIGKVEHATIERCIAEPTRQSVERQFARDVDLLRAMVGDMTRLGAMAGGGTSAWSSLGVQMSGPEGIAARWSVVPIASAAGAKITLTGSRGRAALDMRADDQSWTLEMTVDGQVQRREFAAWDAATASLDDLAAAIDGEAPQPDWVDACRAVELTETIDRSLEKGRTIELYYEDYTEEGTFKGTMTSVGCGLLILAILGLGLVGIAEQMHIPYVRYFPYLLLAIFGLFLFLQLPMLTKGRQKNDIDSPVRAD